MTRTSKNRDAGGHHIGPEYTITSASLLKWRSKAREGLATLSPAERAEYGAAVSAAVLSAQRAQCRGHCEPDHKSPSASGTWHNDGAAIHAAVAAQQRAALLACPSAIRRARKPEEWQKLYDAAMAEKRQRAERYSKELTFI